MPSFEGNQQSQSENFNATLRTLTKPRPEWKAECLEELVFETTLGRKTLHLNFRQLRIKVLKYSHISIQTVKPGPEIFLFFPLDLELPQSSTISDLDPAKVVSVLLLCKFPISSTPTLKNLGT